MSEITERLRAALGAIWTEPPEGLAELARMHRPPSADLPKRLYANFDAYWLAGILYRLREAAAAEGLDRGTLGAIAAMVAETAASRLATWGFAESADVVGATVPALRGASSVEELRAILAELVTYIDRIHTWIDATIPWAGMDALEPGPAESGSP